MKKKSYLRESNQAHRFTLSWKRRRLKNCRSVKVFLPPLAPLLFCAKIETKRCKVSWVFIICDVNSIPISIHTGFLYTLDVLKRRRKKKDWTAPEIFISENWNFLKQFSDSRFCCGSIYSPSLSDSEAECEYFSSAFLPILCNWDWLLWIIVDSLVPKNEIKKKMFVFWFYSFF